MSGITIVLKYLGIPCFILGLLIAAVIVYQSNVGASAFYTVSEVCSGPNCVGYKNLLIYANATCNAIDNSSVFKNPNQCINVATNSGFNNVDAIFGYKSSISTLSDTNSNLNKQITDLNAKLSKLQSDYNSLDADFIQALPAELFCYATSNHIVEYSYQVSHDNITTTPINVDSKFGTIPMQYCARCNNFVNGTDFVICHDPNDDGGSFRPHTGEENEKCTTVCNDGSCANAKIVTSPYVTNETINITVGPKTPRVEINQSLSIEIRKELIKRLGQVDCYMNPVLTMQFQEEQIYQNHLPIFTDTGAGGGSGMVIEFNSSAFKNATIIINKVMTK
jgi:hypothetical protein